MAERRKPLVKKTDEIVEDLIAGHGEALLSGNENGKRYLLNVLEKQNSIPNAAKFFIYDLLAEDAYRTNDLLLCRQAVERSGAYLQEAQAESGRRLTAYLPALRFIERGISIMVDAGECEKALSLCDLALAIGLGKVYAAKRASIERMMR